MARFGAPAVPPVDEFGSDEQGDDEAELSVSVSQRQLLQEVWGPECGEESNYLRDFMAQLRRKLEPEPSRPQYFITEPGMGYRFAPPTS